MTVDDFVWLIRNKFNEALSETDLDKSRIILMLDVVIAKACLSELKKEYFKENVG